MPIRAVRLKAQDHRSILTLCFIAISFPGVGALIFAVDTMPVGSKLLTVLLIVHTDSMGKSKCYHDLSLHLLLFLFQLLVSRKQQSVRLALSRGHLLVIPTQQEPDSEPDARDNCDQYAKQ